MFRNDVLWWFKIYKDMKLIHWWLINDEKNQLISWGVRNRDAYFTNRWYNGMRVQCISHGQLRFNIWVEYQLLAASEIPNLIL